ncbi:hypothetical protein GOBAR_DD10847 [Gossypium barbadense]|nr:hypothetical protein GOBAR_DD10847 [Gossypium barbadense]
MNRQKPKPVTVGDLVEEAKKRIVILAICVVGLSYLMSVTSSSVLVNLPAAASLIILLRYFSLEYEMRRKADAYNIKSEATDASTSKQPPEGPKVVGHCDWRRKVNSPVVENAIDQFTRHLISEWVTDLWYSRLTPDKEGPEELVQIINGVFGELSDRMRNINLVDLLTRDLINLFCSHLELFRISKAKFENRQSVPLTIEYRDAEIRRVLAAENKLHPALFSTEAEHKVLQHLTNGLISLTFRPEDLQCTFFRYVVRELLACAVIRPVINLVSPRFINERIESAVISMTKAKRGLNAAQDASQHKPNSSSKIPSDHFSKFLDPSVTGVELVQLKTNQSGAAGGTTAADNLNGTQLSKDPLLSMDTRTSRSWNSVSLNSQTGAERGIERHRSGGEWGDMLDLMSRRKTEALAPENFENMWTKGRNYKKKEGEKRLTEQVPQHSSAGNPATVDHSKVVSKTRDKYPTKLNSSESHGAQHALTDQWKIEKSFPHEVRNVPHCSSVLSYQEDDDHDLVDLEKVESESNDSFTSGEEETGNVLGLDATGTKVWDSKSNRNLTVSHIHHPLENPEGHMVKKAGGRRVHYRRLTRATSSRKRSRLTGQKLPVWQEVERTSFLSGDGQDILNSLNGHGKAEYSSDDSEAEFFGRLHSGASASSSASSVAVSETYNLTANSLQSSLAFAIISYIERVEDASELLLDAATYPTLPVEWVPPNLTAPLLDLVDDIFQLQDGGWIRRKAFWVAKQILQLGMGDAFDDWLIEKIQMLRKGSVVASGIKRIEQILWPDGIFITKHPRRQRPPPSSSPSQASPRSQSPELSSPRLTAEQQQLEAERRAKFVYELMIDKAPAAIVGLVGHKEYEQCAKDLYFFIQSSVCLKLLAYDLIELLMLSAFPEMEYVFKQLHEEKHKFGEYKAN